jgi:hypothetical protein
MRGGNLAKPIRNPVRFTPGELLLQARHDLFDAKEVQTGYTVTYTWLANQLGHIALGFIISHVLIWLLESIKDDFIEPWFHWGINTLWLDIALPLIVAAWIVFKEYQDYTDAAGRATKGGIFPLDAGDVRLDAMTAVYFTAGGAVVTSIEWWGGDFHTLWPLLALALLLLFGLIPASYWLPRKKNFQQAGLPFTFRLSDFPPTDPNARKKPKTCKPATQKPITKISVSIESVDARNLPDAERKKMICDEINQFIDGSEEYEHCDHRHMLVFGGRASGKTSFAAGIGTEFAFRLGKTRYVNFFQFLQIANEAVEPKLQADIVLWPWSECSILIVDNVDPGIAEDPITPDTVRQMVGTLKDWAKGTLKKPNLRTVWVLDDGDDEKIRRWKSAFCEILSSEERYIEVVRLRKSRV